MYGSLADHWFSIVFLFAMWALLMFSTARSPREPTRPPVGGPRGYGRRSRTTPQCGPTASLSRERN